MGDRSTVRPGPTSACDRVCSQCRGYRTSAPPEPPKALARERIPRSLLRARVLVLDRPPRALVLVPRIEEAGGARRRRRGVEMVERVLGLGEHLFGLVVLGVDSERLLVAGGGGGIALLVELVPGQLHLARDEHACEIVVRPRRLGRRRRRGPA